MSLERPIGISKDYLDIYLNQILKKENITMEEKNIIYSSRKKYRRFLFLNFCLFGYCLKKIYYNCIPYNFYHKLNFQVARFCSLSLIIMIYIYNYSNDQYYTDNRFLIEKHFKIDEDRYQTSIINREIAKLYTKKNL